MYDIPFEFNFVSLGLCGMRKVVEMIRKGAKFSKQICYVDSSFSISVSDVVYAKTTA